MDHFPSINKVFSLVLWEEKQRGLSNGSTPHISTSIALVSKSSTSSPNLKGSRKEQHSMWKDNVICSHCGYTYHTVDKCYKIYGYPSSWKSNKNKSSVTSAMNQVSIDHNAQGALDSSKISALQEQCRHLLALLQSL